MSDCPTELQDRRDYLAHLVTCEKCATAEQQAGDFLVDRSAIAYLVVYEIHRSYGGPEEGGWYDHYEWKRVAVPFQAVVVYERQEYHDTEDENRLSWVQDHSGWRCWSEQEAAGERGETSETVGVAWVPRHVETLPEASEAAHRAQAEAYLARLWPPNTSHRFSMAPKGSDHVILVEVGNPGAREYESRPRYS